MDTKTRFIYRIACSSEKLPLYKIYDIGSNPYFYIISELNIKYNTSEINGIIDAVKTIRGYINKD